MPTPAKCTCAEIREAMMDGCHNPEGMEEWRESNGHYPGCPLSPPEPASLMPTDPSEFPTSPSQAAADFAKANGLRMTHLSLQDQLDVLRVLRLALARVAELESAGASSEPDGWLVRCPPGREFDALICADSHEAQRWADEFNDAREQGDPAEYAPEPVYRPGKMAPLVAQLEADRDRLAAVVAKLPKTADGVPITVGMELYLANGQPTTAHYIRHVEGGNGIVNIRPNHVDVHPSLLYSTRAAAEAARAAEGMRP